MAGADGAAAGEFLQRVADGLIANGTACAVAVRAGEPAATIVEAARERQADLVVMATHGRSGIGRAVLGSVAEGVLAGGRVPVLLVRPGGRPVSTVRALLVPLDGSPGGAIALGIALGLARATGASLVLLQVVVPLSAAAYGGDSLTGADGWTWDPTWDDEAVRAAQGYEDGMAGRLRHAGVVVES